MSLDPSYSKGVLKMDNNDFEIIYKKYVSKVFSFILKLSGNYYVAEEITQETFVKAYTALPSFRGECRLEVWLCQIAKNLFFDYIKQRSRESNTDSEIERPTHFQSHVENQIIIQEDFERLTHAVTDLNEPYRSVMIDYLFIGLSYKEISAKYKKTENWARVNYHRAKQKIKEELS